MRGNSRPVVAGAASEAEDLMRIARRYCAESFLRPIENESKTRQEIIELAAGRPLILDAGCGVGESSFHLAKRYPHCLVLGVDKSADRVKRNNSFKRKMPENARLIVADMQGVWPLLWKMARAGEIKVEKQYILYPNPWPKKKALKKRWYAHPVLPYILELSPRIELRSNWKRYLEEFAVVYAGMAKGQSDLTSFIPEAELTPFERKYRLSGQTLYRLELNRDEA